MATGVPAVPLFLLAFLILGGTAVSQDVSGINSFGESTDELLETARMVANLLEVTHPRGGHRSQRYVRSTELAAARSALSEALDNASLPRRLQFTEYADKHTPYSCRACYIVAHNLIGRIREYDYGDRDDIIEICNDLCIRLNVSTPEVCCGITETNAERGVTASLMLHHRRNREVLNFMDSIYMTSLLPKEDALIYVLKESAKIETRKVCSSLLRECDDGGPELEWPLQESLGVRTPIKPQPFVTNLKITSKPKPVRILHVTDFHFDSLYNIGGNAECGLPLCCRKRQGNASNTTNRAGRWGDYRRCDIPWDTVVEFCKHVDETHKVDFVYFTGDIVDHGVWDTTREGNIKMIRDVYKHFRKTVGRKTKVFPIVGNHEPHPFNLFVPGDAPVKDAISSKWLYELLAEEWSYWLPADTRETILLGGYYTVRVNSKLRVVALNTMFCYNLNWWLMYDPVDPAGQLSWLVRILKEAEAAGEKVHILSHIPPGSGDCLKTWSEHFWRIVKRFSDTIAGQFNGHSHWDEMRIFYTDDGNGNAWPFSAALNAGSLTTYSDVNPNYKIYIVDGSDKDATWQVTDSEVWGFNLTNANIKPSERPHWFKMHSFADKYDIPSMHVTHLDSLVRRFASDRETRYLYWKLGSRMADSSLSWGCDDACLRQELCKLVTTETGNSKYCHLFFDDML